MGDDGTMIGAVEGFLRAFNAGDFEALRAVLGDSMVAFVTTDDGGQATVEGADAYVRSLREMLQKEPTEYSVAFTQAPVMVGADRVLAMMEIRAARGGRTLHNYSAQLYRFDGALVSEIQMTDAKPEESTRFWE